MAKCMVVEGHGPLPTVVPTLTRMASGWSVQGRRGIWHVTPDTSSWSVFVIVETMGVRRWNSSIRAFE
jgi:hypothetical protein